MKRRVVTGVILGLAVASCRGPERNPVPSPEPGHTRLTELGITAEDPCPATGRLLFARRDPGQDFQIWSLSATGPAVQLFIGRPGDVRAPATSPDGERLAWSGNERGTWDIFSISTSSGGSAHSPFLVAGLDDDETGPTWAPDGKRLAWAAFDRRTAAWRLRVGDGTSEARDLGEGFAPSWHPSGDRLVCQRARPGGGLWRPVIVEIATRKG